MIYKLTSVQKVIAKVFSDLQLQEGDHRISDMIEYAGEAVEKIGAFTQFEHKVTGKEDLPLLELSNYQAVLPFDLHKITQIAYSSSPNGPFYPMRRASGSFDSATPSTIASEYDGVASENSIVNLAMTLYDLTYEQALTKINDDPATRTILSNLLSVDNPAPKSSGGAGTVTSDFTYVCTSNYVKTNIQEGYLMVAYQAIPTDADGYPMIPDLASYREAIYWYINMKLSYPQWKLGQIRDAVYYDARRSWNYYCKQAYGDALMPDKDEMESIKNTWLKLIPEINAHSNFYNTIGQQEVIYNHNRT